MAKFSAIDIKRLWYADEVTAAVTPTTLRAMVYGSTSANPTAKEILNVHQDTWQIEEGEASQDSYKNQLNGHTYRLGKRQMGDLTIAFTVGEYDYEIKHDLMGGDMLDSSGEVTTTAANAVGWARSNEAVELYKTLIALTVDDVFLVLSRASMGVREANTDKAIGLAVAGTMTEPKTTGISSEYWYNKSAVAPSTYDGGGAVG